MLIVPRTPQGKAVVNRDARGLGELSLRQPLLSPRIIGGAALAAAAHPGASLRALALLFRSRNLPTLIRNLAVFPKGLWIGRLARRWNADHIHAQWGLTTATMALVASTISGIPWSCTLHRGDIVDNNLLATKLRRAALARFIARDGMAIAESICGRPLPGRVVLLHSCVDMPEQFEFREATSSPPILICPGYLIERKGHKYLIEAVRMLRESGLEVKLWIAGDGELRASLESLVAQCGLQSQVEFLGQVEHAKLLEMFRQAAVDAVVLPTLHEGIPAALIEPMGYGIPVISTDVGGIPELLEGGAGIMVPPRDPAALAEAVRRLFADPALRRQLVETGRQRVAEGWATRNVVSRLLQHLEQAQEQTAAGKV